MILGKCIVDSILLDVYHVNLILGRIISVPKDIVAKDASTPEHQLDPNTVLRFTRVVEFIAQATATKHPKFIVRLYAVFPNFLQFLL